ncbi:TPA: hypothetical protein DF272_06810 [Candidatus Falkowbacteria bacterium]|nr:hypothetical protein [Candidatus Falkowbacteria bacterium]
MDPDDAKFNFFVWLAGLSQGAIKPVNLKDSTEQEAAIYTKGQQLTKHLIKGKLLKEEKAKRFHYDSNAYHRDGRWIYFTLSPFDLVSYDLTLMIVAEISHSSNPQTRPRLASVAALIVKSEIKASDIPFLREDMVVAIALFDSPDSDKAPELVMAEKRADSGYNLSVFSTLYGEIENWLSM